MATYDEVLAATADLQGRINGDPRLLGCEAHFTGDESAGYHLTLRDHKVTLHLAGAEFADTLAEQADALIERVHRHRGL